MKSTSRILTLLIAWILLSGCATIPQTTVESNGTAVAVTPTPTVTHQIPSSTATPASPTPALLQSVHLPEEDEVIFTIPNNEPWSGREGDQRPDWNGWGAETFAIGPDGAFWIADTAVTPNRLLQCSPQGALLQELSLENIAVYVYDILVTRAGIWVLDISAQQPRALKLSLEGELLSTVDIPPEMMTVDGSFVSNGAFALLPGEGEGLLLGTLNGYYELVDASGKIVARPLEGLTFNGHTYQEGIYNPATGGRSAYLNGTPLETGADFMVESPLLGFSPDGSFALAGYARTDDDQGDGQVMYFDAAGNLLGTARQRPQTFYKDWNHHLAFGPDGAVYQLLSNPDHAVQILRLGFAETLPPRQETLLATPTALAPLSPAKAAATEAEQARNTLIEFFVDLSTGNYAEAAARFGGELSEYARAPLPGETMDAYWEYICGFLWCLPAGDITAVEQVSENEFVFYTVFVHPDGARFEIGACCGGDPAASPPVWQFAYPVERIDGIWKVIRPPLFTP